MFRKYIECHNCGEKVSRRKRIPQPGVVLARCGNCGWGVKGAELIPRWRPVRKGMKKLIACAGDVTKAGSRGCGGTKAFSDGKGWWLCADCGCKIQVARIHR